MSAKGAPLAGRRIVVTRAQKQTAGISERLRTLGADVIECPAISIGPLDDFSHFDEAIRRLDEYDWVIFTSVNGVEAFLARMAETGADPGTLVARRLGAIGPATASALESAVRAPDFMPDTYVAEAVLEQIGDVQGHRILLPRADIARKALADGLRLKGAQVDEVAAYRTMPGEGSGRLEGLLRAGEVDAITFTSSSTVRYTIEGLESGGLDAPDAVDLLNRTRVVCIGPVTAGTAQGYGLSVARTAPEYTTDGIVTALLDLFAQDSAVGGGKHA